MSRLCLGSMWYSQSLTTKQNGTVDNTKLLQPVWCCGLDEWRGLAEFVPWLQKNLRWVFSIDSGWGSRIQGIQESNLQIGWPRSPGLLVFKSLTGTSISCRDALAKLVTTRSSTTDLTVSFGKFSNFGLPDFGGRWKSWSCVASKFKNSCWVVETLEVGIIGK